MAFVLFSSAFRRTFFTAQLYFTAGEQLQFRLAAPPVFSPCAVLRERGLLRATRARVREHLDGFRKSSLGPLPNT